MCHPPDARRFQELSAAQWHMDKEYERDMLESYKPALSLLFNAFIMAQVSPRLCALRVPTPAHRTCQCLARYAPDVAAMWCLCVRVQVTNAFVSRRINYELDFFKGVLKSPIFMSIMVLITVLQIIIMQTPISYIFKVCGCTWLVIFASPYT
jgi:Ca2+-transporting ATPase